MRKETKVFLDMDGVIADFMSAICRAHNRPSPYSDPKNFGQFNTEVCWGISADEFWAPVVKNSVSFWENIKKTPEADEIVRVLTEKFGEENIAILTAPSEDIGSVHGKRVWIKENFPQFSKRIIFAGASSKQFLAGYGKVLIDDRDRNIDQFADAGGLGILVPRPWNRGYYIEDSLAHVTTHVEGL